MNMAMIRYLAHHVVDNEVAIAELLSRHERESFYHIGLLLFAGGSPMVAEDGHRRVA